MASVSVATAGSESTATLLYACVAEQGTQAHPHVKGDALADSPDAPRNLADMVHFLCALHGRHPGVIDHAAGRAVEPGARRWLTRASEALGVERAYLARLAVAVGPVPGTPGGAGNEAMLVAQRSALGVLAQSDRRGCALGAALAFAVDWAAVRGPLDRAADILQTLGKEINVSPSPSAENAPSSETPGEAKPIPVEVRSPPPSALDSILGLISPLLHPLATVGVVIVFVVFILFQREDLRNRVIKLAGSNDLQSATAAIDDAAGRLSRFFLMQVALNTSFGVLVGIGLLVIGVPSAILWGILAAIMRFVPYVGVFIAAFFPLTLSVAVDPGWSMLLWAGALIFLTELVIGQVFEPLLVGHSSGLSPVAVVASATFWTAPRTTLRYCSADCW